MLIVGFLPELIRLLGIFSKGGGKWIRCLWGTLPISTIWFTTLFIFYLSRFKGHYFILFFKRIYGFFTLGWIQGIGATNRWAVLNSVNETVMILNLSKYIILGLYTDYLMFACCFRMSGKSSNESHLLPIFQAVLSHTDHHHGLLFPFLKRWVALPDWLMRC